MRHIHQCAFKGATAFEETGKGQRAQRIAMPGPLAGNEPASAHLATRGVPVSLVTALEPGALPPDATDHFPRSRTSVSSGAPFTATHASSAVNTLG
jgi:hypothetical protein